MTDMPRPDVKGADPVVPPMIRRRTNRLLRPAVAGVLAALLLAGCAGGPELDEAAARQFQTRVATAKELAAQQNFAGAVAELDALEAEVGSAAAKGEVSPERRSRIESSISKVRADLQAASAAVQPGPVPTTAAPEPSPGSEEGEEKDKDEGEGGGKGENKGKGKDD